MKKRASPPVQCPNDYGGVEEDRTPRPSHCERDALPAELPPHGRRGFYRKRMARAMIAASPASRYIHADFAAVWLQGSRAVSEEPEGAPARARAKCRRSCSTATRFRSASASSSRCARLSDRVHRRRKGTELRGGRGARPEPGGEPVLSPTASGRRHLHPGLCAPLPVLHGKGERQQGGAEGPPDLRREIFPRRDRRAMFDAKRSRREVERPRAAAAEYEADLERSREMCAILADYGLLEPFTMQATFAPRAASRCRSPACIAWRKRTSRT